MYVYVWSGALVYACSYSYNVYLAESYIQLGVFLCAGQDEVSAAVVDGEITDEHTTLIQLFWTVHPAEEVEEEEEEEDGMIV